MNKKIEDSVVAALEFEWGQEGGFFFDYRNAKFNEEAYLRAYKTILRLDFRGEERISKHIVALIYSIPFFLVCNKDHVVKRGGSNMLCERAIGSFADLLMDKLETV